MDQNTRGRRVRMLHQAALPVGKVCCKKIYRECGSLDRSPSLWTWPYQPTPGHYFFGECAPLRITPPPLASVLDNAGESPPCDQRRLGQSRVSAGGSEHVREIQSCRFHPDKDFLRRRLGIGYLLN